MPRKRRLYDLKVRFSKAEHQEFIDAISGGEEGEI